VSGSSDAATSVFPESAADANSQTKTSFRASWELTSRLSGAARDKRSFRASWESSRSSPSVIPEPEKPERPEASATRRRFCRCCCLRAKVFPAAPSGRPPVLVDVAACQAWDPILPNGEKQQSGNSQSAEEAGAEGSVDPFVTNTAMEKWSPSPTNSFVDIGHRFSEASFFTGSGTMSYPMNSASWGPPNIMLQYPDRDSQHMITPIALQQPDKSSVQVLETAAETEEIVSVKGRMSSSSSSDVEAIQRLSDRSDEDSDSDCDSSLASDAPPEARWALALKVAKKRERSRSKSPCPFGGDFDGDERDEFEKCYDMGPTLGKGTYGTVSQCTHLMSKEVRAVKSVSKKKVPSIKRVMEEVEILHLLKHPNIVGLFETFDVVKYIYIVMELCTGGDLFDKVKESDSGLSEQITIRLVGQITSAVQHMHQACVCHRDLKPENFMVAGSHDLSKATLKIADFGLSSRFEPGGCMRTRAYTLHYVAPEVLNGKYTESCDLWSLGIIVYVLLCGRAPFMGETEPEVLRRIQGGKYAFPDETWGYISDGAKDFIRSLLVVDVESRLSAEQAQSHRWLRRLMDPLQMALWPARSASISISNVWAMARTASARLVANPFPSNPFPSMASSRRQSVVSEDNG